MPRKANTMNLEELSGLCDLGSSPNQQGCFSQSQTDQRTAEVLGQCSNESGPQCWSFIQNSGKSQELLTSWESNWHSSEAPLWSWVCNCILCWPGAEVSCRNPDPDIQEDTFWGNQNSQLKAEDSEDRGSCQNWEREITWKNQFYIPLNEKYWETEKKILNYRTENRLKHQ